MMLHFLPLLHSCLVLQLLRKQRFQCSAPAFVPEMSVLVKCKSPGIHLSENQQTCQRHSLWWKKKGRKASRWPPRRLVEANSIRRADLYPKQAPAFWKKIPNRDILSRTGFRSAWLLLIIWGNPSCAWTYLSLMSAAKSVSWLRTWLRRLVLRDLVYRDDGVCKPMLHNLKPMGFGMFTSRTVAYYKWQGRNLF